MNIALFISRKYFFSKKKRNFINFIAIISMGSLSVAAAAMIIVLSGFNGMEDFLKSLFVSFDPDLRLMPTSGKTLLYDRLPIEKIKQIEGVHYLTPVIEDKVLIRYKEKKTIAKIKGVGADFFKQNELDRKIVRGHSVLQRDSTNYAIVGVGIQYRLGVVVDDAFFPLQVIFPKRTKGISAVPETSFNQMLIMPVGVFALEKQYDEQYVFVPLAFAQELLSARGKVSSLEIKLKTGADTDEVKERIAAIVGEDCKILNRDQQNQVQLKVLKTEKLIAYFILTVIILIASLNIFLCLTMLVIEKKYDIAIIKSYGGDAKFIFRIFMYEGLIMSFLGGFLGVLLGLAVCFVQIKYQLARLGAETAILDAYPIKIEVLDVVIAFFTILVITLLSSIIPAVKASRVHIKDYL